MDAEKAGQERESTGSAVRVLVACEFSGIVRDAFTAAGHDAWSCDLLPSETPGNHYQCCVEGKLDRKFGWDLIIAHPPCTHLCGSGARWWAGRQEEQMRAIEFFMLMVDAPAPMVAVENPVGVMSRRYRKPDQYIQPWQFGHPETKKTGLWLKGLPLLEPTNIVAGREARIHRMAPSKDRAKERSRFYPGIARAMAEQWG